MVGTELMLIRFVLPPVSSAVTVTGAGTSARNVSVASLRLRLSSALVGLPIEPPTLKAPLVTATMPVLPVTLVLKMLPAQFTTPPAIVRVPRAVQLFVGERLILASEMFPAK